MAASYYGNQKCYLNPLHLHTLRYICAKFHIHIKKWIRRVGHMCSQCFGVKTKTNIANRNFGKAFYFCLIPSHTLFPWQQENSHSHLNIWFDPVNQNVIAHKNREKVTHAGTSFIETAPIYNSSYDNKWNMLLFCPFLAHFDNPFSNPIWPQMTFKN